MANCSTVRFAANYSPNEHKIAGAEAMKLAILIRAGIRWIAVVTFGCAINGVHAQSGETIRLNQDAFAFAAQLVKERQVIADGKGAWSKHRPSANEENEFIRLHGFGQYAKWHLGIDDRYPENTKRKYKFPYGDFRNIHRCGLLAARSRAAEYRYRDIEDAADRLIEMMKLSSRRIDRRYSLAVPGVQKRVDQFR
jgi:hypothetical protein